MKVREPASLRERSKDTKVRHACGTHTRSVATPLDYESAGAIRGTGQDKAIGRIVDGKYAAVESVVVKQQHPVQKPIGNAQSTAARVEGPDPYIVQLIGRQAGQGHIEAAGRV